MADVINITAEDNRNIIDDEAVPALELESTHASGVGARVTNTNASGGLALDVDSTAGAGIDVDAVGVGVDVDVSGSDEAVNALSVGGIALVARSQATASHVLDVAHSTAVASPTVAPMKLSSSAASGALFEFNSSLISTASLSVIGGAFPVKMTGEDKMIYLVGYEIV